MNGHSVQARLVTREGNCELAGKFLGLEFVLKLLHKGNKHRCSESKFLKFRFLKSTISHSYFLVPVDQTYHLFPSSADKLPVVY